TMHRGRFIFAAVIALVAAGAHAATTPVVSTDFTAQDAQRLPSNWSLAGSSGFAMTFDEGAAAIQGVSLTNNAQSLGGAMWTNDTFTLPSFTMYADVNVDFHPAGPGVDATCPADGFAMAFANASNP